MDLIFETHKDRVFRGNYKNSQGIIALIAFNLKKLLFFGKLAKNQSLNYNIQK